APPTRRHHDARPMPPLIDELEAQRPRITRRIELQADSALAGGNESDPLRQARRLLPRRPASRLEVDNDHPRPPAADRLLAPPPPAPPPPRPPPPHPNRPARPPQKRRRHQHCSGPTPRPSPQTTPRRGGGGGGGAVFRGLSPGPPAPPPAPRTHSRLSRSANR